MPTPWRRITPLAADASVRSSSGSSSPSEAANLWTLSPSTAPLRAALSSASHEDKAMFDWSLHHQLIVCWPRHTTPPLVLFSGDLVSSPFGIGEHSNTLRFSLELVPDRHSRLPLQLSYYAFDQLIISLLGAAHVAGSNTKRKTQIRPIQGYIIDSSCRPAIQSRICGAHIFRLGPTHCLLKEHSGFDVGRGNRIATCHIPLLTMLATCLSSPSSSMPVWVKRMTRPRN